MLTQPYNFYFRELSHGGELCVCQAFSSTLICSRILNMLDSFQEIVHYSCKYLYMYISPWLWCWYIQLLLLVLIKAMYTQYTLSSNPPRDYVISNLNKHKFKSSRLQFFLQYIWGVKIEMQLSITTKMFYEDKYHLTYFLFSFQQENYSLYGKVNNVCRYRYSKFMWKNTHCYSVPSYFRKDFNMHGIAKCVIPTNFL